MPHPSRLLPLLATAVLMACQTAAPALPTATFAPSTPALTQTAATQTPTLAPIATNAMEITVPATPTRPTAAVEPSPTPIPTLPAAVPALNGVPLAQLLWLPPPTAEHIQQVYALGQTLGRDAHRFSKLGDSIIATPNYLARFDHPEQYNLGPYGGQQATLDYYAGSWQRFGVAVRIGLTASRAFDPMWADKTWCNPNEAMLACEIRLHNPAILLIQLGTNDTNSSFERYLGEIVVYALEQGIIPILYTKADRFEAAVYPDDNHNNAIIRAIAAEHAVPLIEFDQLAATMPQRGLGEDHTHLTTMLQDDYTQPAAYETGHAMHNLLTMLMLEAVGELVMNNE